MVFFFSFILYISIISHLYPNLVRVLSFAYEQMHYHCKKFEKFDIQNFKIPIKDTRTITVNERIFCMKDQRSNIVEGNYKREGDNVK